MMMNAPMIDPISDNRPPTPAQMTIDKLKVVSNCAGDTYCVSVTQQQPATAAIRPEIV